MFSACITYFGVWTLTPVDGNINSENYIAILDDNLWHFANNPWSMPRSMLPGGRLHGKQKTECLLYLGHLKAQILTLYKISGK
jgi:hypothetical protein